MSELARRIGPVYAVEELCGLLTASGAPALTAEVVRKRARQRTLVAFPAGSPSPAPTVRATGRWSPPR